jgi:tripeptidyl-peptidase-1
MMCHMIAALLLSSILDPAAEQVGWVLSETRVDPRHPVNFTLVVRQQNLAELRSQALSVSTPGQPSYGKHLTLQEIEALTAPFAKDIGVVAAFLEHHGLDFTLRHEAVHVSTSSGRAAAALGTSFHRVHHAALGVSRVISDGRLSLPHDVTSRVSAVFGLRGLPLPTASRPARGLPVGGEKVTPAVLASTYSISGVSVERGAPQHVQAVAEFQGQRMSAPDLVTFFNRTVHHSQPGDAVVSRYVGEDYREGHGAEAELDIEYIMGVSPGIATEFWEWPANDFCKDLYQFTTELIASNVSVMSISYGWQGRLTEVHCTPAEVSSIDDNFAKLAARGASVLISSGDSGSGFKRKFIFGYELYPSWPASSPWVTAVGATKFVDDKIGAEETASEQFGSGGGFSSMFNQSDAPWQVAAVAAYGRATPDVSALGEGYQVWIDQSYESIGGTSASCPATAGMVSLINEARRQSGKPPLGFLNPFLYSNPGAFTDITKGTNAISRDSLPVKVGYAATEGWDAATGLGTPIFSKLLAAALTV